MTVFKLPLLLAVVLLAGCESLAYYMQSARGQLGLVSQAKPIGELLEAGDIEPGLASRLRRAQEIREFGNEHLGLPDNGSYRSYADIGRRAVVWSLVATPRYAVEAKRWCYPLLGCLSYRGYFEESAAHTAAQHLHAEGMDVAVLPVPAYSTLGWFADPLPSTVIHWPEPELAGLMFHELAHQRVYIPDDTAFNESYAGAVARIGVGLWLADRPDMLHAWQERQMRSQQVTGLLLAARAQLSEAFREAGDDAERQRLKEAVFASLSDDFRRLTAAWPTPHPYGHWFADGRLNNAYLAQVATYDQWLGAFMQLWLDQGRVPAAFHDAVEKLGERPAAERQQTLEALSAAWLSAARADP